MFYKEDWSETRKRYEAWWEKRLPRPIIQVTAPRKKPLKETPSLPHPCPEKSKKPVDINWILMDWIVSCEVQNKFSTPDYVINRWENYFNNVFFGGDSYPNLWLNLGPGILAAYITDFLTFEVETTWFELERPMEWKEILNIKFNEENRWWQITKKLAYEISKYAKGKFIVGTTDIGGITDVLASLRRTQNLLIDLIDHPQEVKEASKIITEIWLYCYDELNKIIQTNIEGSSAWMGIWCHKRWYPIHCDFSAMISPKMFEEFVLPYLQIQCQKLDHTIYHWDGPGQIPHLDLLLSIPELDGIQWVPGAGNEPTDSEVWYPLYEKIQKAGKLLVLQGVRKENIKHLLQNLSPKGLLISTTGNSEEEVEDLLSKI